jgi:hypothetical protein
VHPPPAPIYNIQAWCLLSGKGKQKYALKDGTAKEQNSKEKKKLIHCVVL